MNHVTIILLLFLLVYLSKLCVHLVLTWFDYFSLDVVCNIDNKTKAFYSFSEIKFFLLKYRLQERSWNFGTPCILQFFIFFVIFFHNSSSIKSHNLINFSVLGIATLFLASTCVTKLPLLGGSKFKGVVFRWCTLYDSLCYYFTHMFIIQNDITVL